MENHSSFLGGLLFIIKDEKYMDIRDFTFEFKGAGHYKVTYTSPKTGKQWSKTITDMTIIDDTKNCENPKKKDLNHLKRMVKL